MEYLFVVLFIICIFFMGSSVFSFVNAAAGRWERSRGFVWDKSRCDCCGREILPYDLIPVISYIILAGKCRYCGRTLSIRYLITEILGGLLALYCTYYYVGEDLGGSVAKAVLAFLFCGVLCFIFITDIDTMRIPDGASAFTAALGIAAVFVFKEQSILERVIGAFSVSVPMLLTAAAVKGAFGGGDIKLMFGAGLFLGWRLSLFAFFTAVILGGIYALWLLAVKKAEKRDRFAFGPFLAAGTAGALFWGNYLIKLYLNFYL